MVWRLKYSKLWLNKAILSWLMMLRINFLDINDIALRKPYNKKIFSFLDWANALSSISEFDSSLSKLIKL
jgi:hypothetical protein